MKLDTDPAAARTRHSVMQRGASRRGARLMGRRGVSRRGDRLMGRSRCGRASLPRRLARVAAA